MIGHKAWYGGQRRLGSNYTGPPQRGDDVGSEDPGRLSNSSRETQATVPGSAAHTARAIVCRRQEDR